MRQYHSAQKKLRNVYLRGLHHSKRDKKYALIRFACNLKWHCRKADSVYWMFKDESQAN